MSEPQPKKLYWYVDETGQDTAGDFFLVSVVVTEDEQAAFIHQLERIEAETGKRQIKWHKTSVQRRVAYVRAWHSSCRRFCGDFCVMRLNEKITRASCTKNRGSAAS